MRPEFSLRVWRVRLELVRCPSDMRTTFLCLLGEAKRERLDMIATISVLPLLLSQFYKQEIGLW